MNNTTDPAAAPAAPARKIAFQAARPFERITLDYPLSVDDIAVAEIDVHRLTMGEVAEFQDQAGDDMRFIKFPMFRYISGERVPDDVLAALDDDDALKLTEAAMRFLPRRYRVETVSSSDTSRGDGDNIGPT